MRIQLEIDKIGALLFKKSVSKSVQLRPIDDFTTNCLYFAVQFSAWWLDNSETENINKVV